MKKTLSFTINYDAVWAEVMRWNHWKLAVIGNQKTLGNWEPKHAVVMKNTNFRLWKVTVDASDWNFPMEYKYVLFNEETQKIVSWENRDNRFTYGEPFQKTNNVCFIDDKLSFDKSWFRGVGVAIPIFSLRSKKSCGIGDFNDLKDFSVWAKNTGLQMIQLLPITDTTLQRNVSDSYPYNSLSVFALNPMYLSPFSIGTLKDKIKQKQFETSFKQLNQLPKIDYNNVCSEKWNFFRAIYKEQQEDFFQNKDYQEFYEKNKNWLVPYAVFSTLRDKFHTTNFRDWEILSTYKSKEVFHFATENRVEVGLYFFLQYHLDKQLSEAVQFAHHFGIKIKGDIPIGVSADSVDVWQNPELFHTNMQAGAPPDTFSESGQNWGFPTYKWERMSIDKYFWWNLRLWAMAKYFDAYRIDHILGFFRIWQVPKSEIWGLLGHFSPAIPLSFEEIKLAKIPLSKEELLLPLFTENELKKSFSENYNNLKKLFFEAYNEKYYTFRKDVFSQQDIRSKAIAQRISNEDCKELLKLRCQVLFVEDGNDSSYLHPRIGIENNMATKRLTPEELSNYGQLYEEFFYHRHNEFWEKSAMQKLPILVGSTPMISCGEDLGMIPSCVPTVMQKLQILSLEIQRMPKQYGRKFDELNNIPYLSVCTTSTHDMSPLRLWWEEEEDQRNCYWNESLHQSGIAPEECNETIATQIIKHHLQSPAMWTIFPLQDILAMKQKYCDVPQEERINVPDNPNNEWTFRMKTPIETLISDVDFSEKIKKLCAECSRKNME